MTSSEQLTTGTLLASLVVALNVNSVPADSPVFWYFGPEGLTIQAEPPGGDAVVLITVPVSISNGGPLTKC